jgi:thiol-disulfide isomerase/thioredoxin
MVWGVQLLILTYCSPVADTSANSFRVIFYFMMCKRYVLLPLAGNRNNNNGSLNNAGSNVNYWSSTVSGTNSRNLNFNSSNANMNSNNRANGFSVRCLKDYCMWLSQPFFILMIILLSRPIATGQIITGYLPLNAYQSIRLEGFNGLRSYSISSTAADSSGHFILSYHLEDYGVGTLSVGDETPFILVLTGEDIEIRGESLDIPMTISMIHGQENQWFQQYGMEHPKRERALSAWTFLKDMYTSDSLFSMHQVPRTSIQKEIHRIQQEDVSYLNRMPIESYVRWYLLLRKLVSSVSSIAQYRAEEIPGAIATFRKLDYSDPLLYKSGLLKDVIESHFWLLANGGWSLDSTFIEMKISIDAMIESLALDEQKLNEVTEYLFDLLERYSLFQASEYLALKVLNEVNCTIESDLAKQLETYRAMKKGNIAPDIIFGGDYLAPGYALGDVPQKLSDISSSYTLVIFGASWCPKCAEELPQILKSYDQWKKQGMEVIYISLDEEKEVHSSFTRPFPFISLCDYKKWDSDIVKDYYVFATPTMYLLDNQRKILLRPNSVKQIAAWVDWYLVQGNK